MRNTHDFINPSDELVRLASAGLLETKEDPEGHEELDVKKILSELGEKQGRRFGEVETETKNIAKRLDDFEKRMNRLSLSGGGSSSEFKSDGSWAKFARTGDFERRDMSFGSGPDGGFWVPEQWSQRIVQIQRLTSPMRRISNVETVSTAALDVPIDADEIEAQWTGETSSRPNTTTPQIKVISIPAHEIYSNPRASQTILDDSRIDIEAWLAMRIADRFSRRENAAFVSGSGVGQPFGFLSYPTVANASWAWGSLGFIKTGANGAFAASNPADKLKELKYSLKSGYRANARWLMNSDTAAIVSQFKDTTGRYIWADSVAQGEPPTLFGHPVEFGEDVPAMATGSFSVAFGDFSQGYTIVDRVGIRSLRDPYSAKPWVSFYCTKRVGGAVTNFEAIKLLQFSA